MPRKPKAVASHAVVVRKNQKPSAVVAASPSTNASGSDQTNPDLPNRSVDSLAPIIVEIRAWHRDRVFAMESRKSDSLRLGAHLRYALGWSRLLPKAQSDEIKKRAKELMALGEAIAEADSREKDRRKVPAKLAKQRTAAWSDPDFARYGLTIMASIQSRGPWDAIEDNATKQMERLARLLPVWKSFGEGVKGFGARTLAVIVGEAGDLSNYRGPKNGQGIARLWKRMGLAPIEKDGRTHAGSTWRRVGGFSKDDWIEAGYSPVRRSYAYANIAEPLIKQQVRSIKDDDGEPIGHSIANGPYGAIYLEQKQKYLERGWDKLHAHRGAHRYMEKRLLKHLWQAWRRASVVVETISNLPAADSERQTNRRALPDERLSAARSAKHRVTPRSGLPSAPIPAKAGKRRADSSLKTKTKVPAASSSAQAERSATRNVMPITSLPSAETSQTTPVAKPLHALSGKRRATSRVQTIGALPAASSSAQAERSALHNVSPRLVVPSASIPAKAGKRRAKGAVQTNSMLPAAEIGSVP